MPADPVYAQFSASEVIGQYDSSDQPTFDQGEVNSRARANPYGFDYQVFSVEDSVRHRLYVSDTNNNRVLVWELEDDNSINFDQLADYVIGQPDFVSYTNGTTQSTLYSPQYLAIDETNGKLFVSDVFNKRVMVFDVSGSITNGMNAINVIGKPDFTYTGAGVRAQNRFYGQKGLAFDSTTEYLYVADDAAHRVLVFDVNSITDGENAIHVLGQFNFTAGLQGLNAGKFYYPKDVAIDEDNGRLFVTDNMNRRVLVFDVNSITDGENAIHVLGQADFISNTEAVTQNTVHYPRGVAYDPTNQQLFVTQGYEKRVMVFDVASITNGEDATYVLGRDDFVTPSTPQFVSSCAGTVADDEFNFPSGVSLLSNDRVAVGDCRRLAFFDISSITNGEDAYNVLGQTNVKGVPVKDIASRNAQVPASNTLEYPAGMVIDNEHNRLFVADSDNGRVLVYELDSETKELVDADADYVLGAAHFNVVGSYETNQTDMYPLDLEYDADNNYLFVADYGSNRVLVFDVEEITNYESAIHVIGQVDFTTYDYDTTDSLMNEVMLIAYDDQNDWLFVNDAWNYRVLIFDLSGGISDGMTASKVLGQDDFTSAVSASPAQNRFADLEGGIEYDEESRNLFVSDPYNSRILVFTLPESIEDITNGMDADYVLGQSDFVTSGSNYTSDGLDFPLGMSIGEQNDLYVYDCCHRVLFYDTSVISNGMDATGVIGQPNFTDSSTGTSQTSLSCDWVASTAINTETQELYVSDDANHRILIFDLPRITTETADFSTATYDQFYSYDVSTSNTAGSISFSIFSGGLPPGLNVGWDDGLISGTPTGTIAQSFPFSLSLFDDRGDIGLFYDRQDLSIQAQPAPTPTPTVSPTPTSSPTASPTPTSSTEEDDDDDDNSDSDDSDDDSDNSGGVAASLITLPTPTPPFFDSETEEQVLLAVLEDEGLLDENEDLVDDEIVEEVMADLKEYEQGKQQHEKENREKNSSVEKVGSGVAAVIANVGQSSINILRSGIQSLPAVVEDTVAPVSSGVASVTIPSIASLAIMTQFAQQGQRFSLKLFLRIFRVLGLFPSKAPMGLVYSSSTKEPIAFSLLTFKGKEKASGNQIFETVVTGTGGVFQGITLPLGKYSVEVRHQDFRYPTHLKRPSYLRIPEFYKAEEFVVHSSNENQVLLIPVDPINQKSSRNKSLLNHFRVIVSQFSLKHVFHIMFAFSVVLALITPSVLNIAVVVLYLFTYGFQWVRQWITVKISGQVIDQKGSPLQGSIIRISNQAGSPVALVTTNQKGQFSVPIGKDKYQLHVYKMGYVFEQGMKLYQVDTSTGSKKFTLKMKPASQVDFV